MKDADATVQCVPLDFPFSFLRVNGFQAKAGKANRFRSSEELIICCHFRKLKQKGQGHLSHLHCRKVTSAAALVTCDMFFSGSAEAKSLQLFTVLSRDAKDGYEGF